MRTFSKVSPMLWRSDRFCALKSSDARLVHVYFLTCEHQNSAGCFRLPDAYAAADLGWDVERYRTARDEVVSVGLVSVDADTSEVLVDGWFRFNPATNRNHAKGIENALDAIESASLHARARSAYVDLNEKPDGATSGTVKQNGESASRLCSTQYLNGGRQ